jgi:hypothetical protein
MRCTDSDNEDLRVSGGEGGDGGGNIHLFATAYSWVTNVESDASSGSSVNFDCAFRCVHPCKRGACGHHHDDDGPSLSP